MGKKRRRKELKNKFSRPNEIVKVIKSGNIKRLRKIVDKSNKDQPLEDDGSTPLAIAAYMGNLDVVRYLAGEAHAGVNQATTDNGRTPLFVAAGQGNLEVVRYLAGEGHADVNQATTDDGTTPLYIAAGQGNLDMVRYLAGEGHADVNLATTEYGSTPLFVAAGRGSLDVVRYLAGEGHAGVNQATTDSGSTPLYAAASQGNLDMVRYLAGEAHADVNQARTDDGSTPLYVAARQGNLDMVRYLAGEAHADVNQATIDDGYTPLYIAVSQGNLEVVRYLAGVTQADGIQARTYQVAISSADFRESADQSLTNINQIRSSIRVASQDTSSLPGNLSSTPSRACDGVKNATRQAGYPLTITTRHGPAGSTQHLTACQKSRGQKFLRLLTLVGILLRKEHRQAKTPDGIAHIELQERVARFDRALSHREVPSTEQMRAAALRLFGGNNGMSERSKSRLTLAYQTYFMLKRAARRRSKIINPPIGV